ncbi:MAG TPA: type II toxin-antitoxin system VapC family toxin [Terriglobales bacterium]|nr:type II toxin-antitoxin system VapC family toxin [Terriglobales bacterium]
MTNFVLDASVAVKWCLPERDEPLVAQATALLQRYAAGEFRFLIPDLFWAEFGNTMWKAVQGARISARGAVISCSLVRELGLSVISNAELLENALELSLMHERTIYDCLYVALAIQSSATMITADERLANALAARLPVKWLGAF